MPRSEGFGDHPILISTDVSRNSSSIAKNTQNINNDLNSNLHNEFRSNMLEQMKKFRPNSTIFEIGNSSKNEVMSQVMSQKRAKHSTLIEKFKNRNKPENTADDVQCKNLNGNNDNGTTDVDLKKNLEESSQDQIDSTFGANIVQPKAITNAKVFVPKKQKRKSSLQPETSSTKKVKNATKKDDENYIGYHPKDHHTEAG